MAEVLGRGGGGGVQIADVNTGLSLWFCVFACLFVQTYQFIIDLTHSRATSFILLLFFFYCYLFICLFVHFIHLFLFYRNDAKRKRICVDLWSVMFT